MKILNMQFFPTCLLLSPTLLSLEEMYNPGFLVGEVMAEKYLSLALMMNLDFRNGIY